MQLFYFIIMVFHLLDIFYSSISWKSTAEYHFTHLSHNIYWSSSMCRDWAFYWRLNGKQNRFGLWWCYRKIWKTWIGSLTEEPRGNQRSWRVELYFTPMGSEGSNLLTSEPQTKAREQYVSFCFRICHISTCTASKEEWVSGRTGNEGEGEMGISAVFAKEEKKKGATWTRLLTL